MRTFRKLLLSLTVLAVLAGLVSVSPASALPAGTAPEGPVTMNPTSGTVASATFTLTRTSNDCPGDTVNDGFVWTAYIAPASVDPATITFGPAGPQASGSAPLFGGGSPVFNRSTTPISGIITGEPTSYTLGPIASVLADGVYNIGFACHLNSAPFETARYWVTTLTISGGGTSFAQGALAAAPTLNSVTPGDGVLTAAFAPGVSDPAATSFEATATPQGGGTPVSVSGSGSPITITGLTNGTTYDVTVTATNSVGTSGPSNTISATPAIAGQPAVQNLTAVPGAVAGDIEVSWTPPSNAGTLPPVGYTLEVSPADAGPFNLGSAVTSQTVSGLTAGTTYTFTVTAEYPSPDFGTPASVQAVPSAAQVLLQEITVERPAGALILTQRCGVNNAVPGIGYPFSGVGIPATADQVGTSPDVDLVTPGVQDDPEFGNYPFPSPATYPTLCGLDLGTATFVDDGALAGEYYVADGALNEVTVVDTRDDNAGWTVSGTMSTFSGSDPFEGNYLGWIPVVTDTTGGQVVTAGPRVDAGTGVVTAGPGLGDVGGQVLASANAGEGLGIATLDARVSVLIPVSVDAGTYTGTLSLTVV